MKIILSALLFFSLFSSEIPKIPSFIFSSPSSEGKKQPHTSRPPEECNFIETNKLFVFELSKRNEEKNNQALAEENKKLKGRISQLESSMASFKKQIGSLQQNYKILEKSKLKKNQEKNGLCDSPVKLTSVFEVNRDENENLSEVGSEDCQYGLKEEIERLNNQILLFKESADIYERKITEYEEFISQQEQDKEELEKANESFFEECEKKNKLINELEVILGQANSEKEEISTLYKEYQELILKYDLLVKHSEKKETKDAGVQGKIIETKDLHEKLELNTGIVTIEVKPENVIKAQDEIFIQEVYGIPDKRLSDDLDKDAVLMLSGSNEQFTECKKSSLEIINQVVTIAIENENKREEKKGIDTDTQTTGNSFLDFFSRRKKRFFGVGVAFFSLVLFLYLKNKN